MIRQAIQDDAPGIRALMKSEPGFWKQDARPDVLEIEMASGKDLALVWEEEGEILGYACAHDLGFRAYLSHLIVREGVRGRGIAGKLVEHIENALRDRKCAVLISDVWKDAEGFYRSRGWSEPDVVLLRQKLASQPINAADREGTAR